MAFPALESAVGECRSACALHGRAAVQALESTVDALRSDLDAALHGRTASASAERGEALKLRNRLTQVSR
jgi:hypothetical protein